ncbi:phage terminase small subunit [Sphingomonas sp. QA11]|uniref:phage terminase small subunit n=1 Tax=Sphingomonas sp. QA11 TaxID=2950605 RepID=UPI00234A24EE|nr:phage terminase small subunit [Sphingomonas sp. QA11]WCM29182.1 phage terminase small subunit [Sphingomonas sp. QA11]
MSLARQHRERILAAQTVASLEMEGGLPGVPATLGELASDAASQAQGQMTLRLVHDLQRLKQIQSIEQKIAAKREMLPEYRAWIVGLLSAAEQTGRGVQDDILPTIMIWLIDTGQYEDALPLIDYVLRFNIALPTRYERTAPALIVEEIAEAAIKAQALGVSFPLGVLEQVEQLIGKADMHDQIRAKLHKAIGVELADRAEEIDGAAPEFAPAVEGALAHLRRAQQLHDRAGVKDRVRRLEKSIASNTQQAGPDQTDKAG